MKLNISAIAKNHDLCCVTPVPPACMSGATDKEKNRALLEKGCCARCPVQKKKGCNSWQPCPNGRTPDHPHSPKEGVDVLANLHPVKKKILNALAVSPGGLTREALEKAIGCPVDVHAGQLRRDGRIGGDGTLSSPYTRDVDLDEERTEESLVKNDDRIEACAIEIEAGAKTTLEGIARAGSALIEARRLFGENDKAFGQWREKRLPWLDQKTAQRWIMVKNQFGENLLGQNVRVEPSALYLLAAPSTPEPARQEAKERAAKGEKITHKLAKEIKAKHQPPAPKKVQPLEEPTAPPPPPPTKQIWPPFDAPVKAAAPKEDPMGPFNPRPDWKLVPDHYSVDEYPDDPAGRAQETFRSDLAIRMNQLMKESGMSQYDVARFVRDLGEEFIRLQDAIAIGPTQKPKK